MSEKKINLLRPSGTNDILPEEMERRRILTRLIEDHFIKYGYQQIDIPIYDFFDLFEFRSGEKIINDIFTFKDPPIHKVVDPKLYALRPEFTAPFVRFYITSELMHFPKPLKIFYIGSCFRYDEPAPGRYRQFTQAGVEMFGADTAEADAEILIIAMDLVKSLSIQEYTLRINDLTFLRTYLEELDFPLKIQNKIFGIIDKITSSLRKLEIGALDDATEDSLIDEYYSLMGEYEISRDVAGTLENLLYLVGTFVDIKIKLNEVFSRFPKTLEAINNTKLENISKLLKAGGIENFLIDCGIARGLDYYTDMVFEIDIPSLGKQKQVCGGGRYNRLVGDYGGEETPAVGFAFGFERLIIAMENSEALSIKSYSSVLYIGTKEETMEYGIEIAQKLRAQGFSIETDIMGRSFRSSAKYVNKSNIPFMVFLGPREKESGKFTLKNFLTEEQFKDISLSEMVKKIKNFLSKNKEEL